jgi:hypothetical protein
MGQNLQKQDAIFTMVVIFGLLCGMMLINLLGSNYMTGVLQ